MPEPVTEEGGKRVDTAKYQVPPAAGSVVTVVDRGNSSCEFMRCTVNQVPAYPSTANTSHVPMALVCQPFAELTQHEERVPLVNFGESGPFRCTRCKAYANPYFQWVASGREAVCNLCGQRMDVPDEYRCSLDERGQRRDREERPELNRGTVDYVAPRDYSDEMPGVPVTLFVVDASVQSVQSGFLAQVLLTLRGLLDFLRAPRSRIGLVTFSDSIHFYKFHRGAGDAHQVVVSDIDEPFVPCGWNDLIVESDEEVYRGQWEALLEQLPSTFADSPSDQVVGGAALRAAVDLVASCGGGHVVMFHGALPNAGIGALRSRDDIRLYNTPEGMSLLSPQQGQFFEGVAADCLIKGVGVSAFLAPAQNQYIDVATLSLVPRRTGGEIKHLPSFDLHKDGEQLHYAISRCVLQGSTGLDGGPGGAVYSCVFKVRVSKGLTVDNMYATWDAEVIDPSTFSVSRMSVDASAAFALSHGERIEGQKNVYVQAACLHTNGFGHRHIRVHTIQLPVTTSLSNVFRYTDVETVTTLLLRQAAASSLSGATNFKDRLTKSCVDMLHAYRINCASMTSQGQLILPESLKMLPLYVGSIRKMAAFRTATDIRIDDRVAGLLRMLGLPIALVPPLVYPRVYQLCPLDDRAGEPSCGQHVYLPATVACTMEKLVADRIYLLDNGQSLLLYLRPEVQGELLREFFGVESPEHLRAALTSPEAELSEEGHRILSIIYEVQRQRSRLPWQPLSVIVPGTADEPRVLPLLVEDCVAGEMPYVDFLCHVHKLVQNKLD